MTTEKQFNIESRQSFGFQPVALFFSRASLSCKNIRVYFYRQMLCKIGKEHTALYAHDAVLVAIDIQVSIDLKEVGSGLTRSPLGYSDICAPLEGRGGEILPQSIFRTVSHRKPE